MQRICKNSKMKKHSRSILLIALTVMSVAITSCKKENPTPEEPTTPVATETGNAKVALIHQWGNTGADFEMATELTHPMSGEKFTFTTMKYYVSNLRFKNENGTWWAHPESYFLVDVATPASTELAISGIPAGTYTEMSYVLGVDSTRNVSGAQTGALSTTHGMFWSWNTGYIMAKAEGTSPDSQNNSFAYHLGGFQGANNIVTLKTASFGTTPLIVSKNSQSTINLNANIARIFHSMSVATTSNVMMPGATAKSIATNFYDGFSFSSLSN